MYLTGIVNNRKHTSAKIVAITKGLDNGFAIDINGLKYIFSQPPAPQRKVE